MHAELSCILLAYVLNEKALILQFVSYALGKCLFLHLPVWQIPLFGSSLKNVDVEA